LREQLDETGIEPSLFEVEFREDVLFGNEEKALEIMESIKSLGVALSLDDYGSGYSFINYMTRMPVDYLKIHRAITENIQDNGAVMGGLVAIAHGLGMEVVAEQVETLEEAQMLSNVNCDYLQGYLLSKPVKSKEAGDMLELSYADVLEIA
jgi:EAL domain-containing protein (putative c-di-GMP-specific phosphodiesterase class I)